MPVARFLAGAANRTQLPRWGRPEIAFAGRSNVGKSSLLNRLVGERQLARVSKTPGRTQQINFFLVDERMVFVDLPGYGFARVPVAVKQQWKLLIETYLTQRTCLRGVIVIIDLRRGVQPEDAQLMVFLSRHHIPVIVVATKADKLGHGERQRRIQEIVAAAPAGIELHVCSAASGEGIPEVWKAIQAHCE